MKTETGIPINIANDILEKLKTAKDQIDSRVQELEDNNPDYANPVIFDIGIKDTFLEVEQEEETKQFYALNKLSDQTLLVLELLVGILGKWNLISSDAPEATWSKVKGYFQQEMGDKISKGFL